MPLRSSLATVAAVLAVATLARAQEADTPPEESEPQSEHASVAPAETIVGLVGASPAEARAVTSSGRVLGRDASGAWTRVSEGGVGTPLVAARSFGTSDVWAVGAAPPAFRFAGVTWGAAPVRRAGVARLSTCAAPAFASGHRVFVHDGKKWRELRRLPGTTGLASLCLVDAGHGAALLDDGSVLLLAGAWKPLVLPAGAHATWLGGGKTPLLGTDRGEVYSLAGAAPARLVAGAPLAPRAAAASPHHTWLLTDTAVLRVDGRKLVLFADLPAEPGAHDWRFLLAGDDGTLLVLASDGTILRREVSGAWMRDVAKVTEGAPAIRRANPPALVGP